MDKKKRKPLDFKPFYRKQLPHIQPPNATIFVTYRLAGSIPQSVIQTLLDEAAAIERELSKLNDSAERERRLYVEHKRLFGKWDDALDAGLSGPMWLNEPEIASLVAESLHYLDGERYDLDSFCVMGNHVHAVFTPLIKENGDFESLARIMHSLKGYTAIEANKVLGRQGQFWQHESYDHFVRDAEELARIRRYVLLNPVKAGLVENWEDWEWSYCKLQSEHLVRM